MTAASGKYRGAGKDKTSDSVFHAMILGALGCAEACRLAVLVGPAALMEVCAPGPVE